MTGTEKLLTAEERKKRRKKKLGMAIYILPNIFTTANIFWGFFSIIRSFDGRHLHAALAILAASVFDVLDGRIARLTKTTSDFGIQYDSLADIVSFCLAPSLLIFTLSLNQYGRIGWTLCFFLFVCGALRLARFNVQATRSKEKDFIGLPSPMAALVIATFVIFLNEIKGLQQSIPSATFQQITQFITSTTFIDFFMLIAAPALGLLMVSPVRYNSFKDFKLRNTRPFNFLVLMILFLTVVVSKFEVLAFLIVIVYVFSGPALYLLKPAYRAGLDLGIDEHDFALHDDYETEQVHQDEVEIKGPDNPT